VSSASEYLLSSGLQLTRCHYSGYSASCATILKATRKLKNALHSERFSSDLDVLGDPLVSVVAFTVKATSSLKQNDIYMVGDLLGKKGWHLNALSDPPALHMAMTVSWPITSLNFATESSTRWQMLTAKAVDTLLDDLRAVLDQVKVEPSDSGDMVALYGEYASCQTPASCALDHNSHRPRANQRWPSPRPQARRNVHRHLVHDAVTRKLAGIPCDKNRIIVK
jgi:hypothetical protein